MKPTGDGCQSRRRCERNADKMCPTRQTQSSNDIQDDEQAHVGSAEDSPLPDDRNDNPGDKVSRAD